MRKRRAWQLALWLTLLLLAATAFLLIEAGHPCAGADCPICRVLFSLRALLARLGPLPAACAALSVGMLWPLCAHANAGYSHAAVTPVSLRTRMNN